nr:hypothetical protein OH820_15090 [Streptomyces sp. NBC_00857]
MSHPLGTEIEATAKWLEEHSASGAAQVLRRVARQRDEALLAVEHLRSRDPESDRVNNAVLRTELARFQVQAEWAGWVRDPESRRMWLWREDWWELAFRKRNLEDGYQQAGWYLWGPVQSYFGEWTAYRLPDAMTEADRLISKHLAGRAEAQS